MGILGEGAGGAGVRIATASDRSRKNLRVIPRPVCRLVVGIRNTPVQRSGADCHTNDTFIVLCVILFGGAAEEKGAEGFAVKGQQGVKISAARYGLGGGH